MSGGVLVADKPVQRVHVHACACMCMHVRVHMHVHVHAHLHVWSAAQICMATAVGYSIHSSSTGADGIECLD